jgi:hypothetical protein
VVAGGGSKEAAREDDMTTFSKVVCMVRDAGPVISGRDHRVDVTVDPSHRYKAEVHQTGPPEPMTHIGLAMALHDRAMRRMQRDPTISYAGATNAELQADPVLKSGLNASPADSMPGWWSRNGG